jgi:hypothetical protein
LERLDVDKENNATNTFLGSMNELLEDGFVGGHSARDEHHYWPIVRNALSTRKIQFIENLEEYPTDQAKAYVWLLVELNDKRISKMFEEIASNQQILQHYSEEALIKVKKAKI